VKLLLTGIGHRLILSHMAKYSSDLDGAFAALADPTRRAIVSRLCEGPQSVSELARPFDMALPSLLKHVRVLEQSGAWMARAGADLPDRAARATGSAIVDPPARDRMGEAPRPDGGPHPPHEDEEALRP
jgi:hypothetical protein